MILRLAGIALPGIALLLLLWANLWPVTRVEGSMPCHFDDYGWPMAAMERSEDWESADGGFVNEWNAVALVADLSVALGTVLFSVWLARMLLRTPYASRGNRFQIRLSTALAICLTVGALEWANSRWESRGTITLRIRSMDEEVRFVQAEEKGAGWPFHFRFCPESFLWDRQAFLFDVLIGLAIVIASAVLWETWIARRVDRLLVRPANG